MLKQNVARWMQKNYIYDESTLGQEIAWRRHIKKLVPEPVLTKIADTMWRHQATKG